MILRSPALTVDLRRRLVWTVSERPSLTPTEFDLLSYLMQNSDRVISKIELTLLPESSFSFAGGDDSLAG